jgi:Sodium/hydrogen exchanger family
MVITGPALCFALISGVVKRHYVAPALIFVSMGLVLGPSGLGVVQIRAGREDCTILAELALTVILFNQASKTRSTLAVSTRARTAAAGRLPRRLPHDDSDINRFSLRAPTAGPAACDASRLSARPRPG